MMAESSESEYDSDIWQPGLSASCDHCAMAFPDQTSLLRHQATTHRRQERNDLSQLCNGNIGIRITPENDAKAVSLRALNKRIMELDKNDFERSKLFERYAKYTRKRIHRTKDRNGHESKVNEATITNSHALEEDNDLLIETTTKACVPKRKRRSSIDYLLQQNDSLLKETGNIPTLDIVEHISKNSDPKTTKDKVRTNPKPKRSSSVHLKQKHNKSLKGPEIKNIVETITKNDELKRLVVNLTTYFGHNEETRKLTLSRNIYKCKTCYLHFPTAGDLRKHVKKGIHKDKEIKCEYCMLKFSKKTWLKHLAVHEPKKMTKKDFDIVTLVTDSSDTSSDDDDEVQSSASSVLSVPDQEQNLITENLTLTTHIPHTVTLSVSSKEGSVATNETKEDGAEKETNISMDANATVNTMVDENVNTKVLRSGVVRMNTAEDDHKEKKTVNAIKVKKNDAASKISNGVLYKCVRCDEHYITKKRFDNHMALNKHSKENKQASYCQTCNYKFINVQTMANHVSFHHRKQKLKRADLKIITSSSGRDRRQPVKLELGKTEGSDVASNNIRHSKTPVVANKGNFKRASKITDILYRCGHCDSHFVSFNPMASHLHRNCKTKNKILTKRFECKKCDLMFSHNSLLQHESIQHKKLGLNRGDFRIITKEPNDVVDDGSGEFTTSEEHIIRRQLDNIFAKVEVNEGDKNDDDNDDEISTVNKVNFAVTVKDCVVTLAPIDGSSLDTSHEEGVKIDENIDISEDDVMDIDTDVVHSTLEITSPFNNTEALENIMENNEANNMNKEKECSDAAIIPKTPDTHFVIENVSTVIETDKNSETVLTNSYRIPNGFLQNVEETMSEQNEDGDVIDTIQKSFQIKCESENFISPHLIFDD